MFRNNNPRGNQGGFFPDFFDMFSQTGFMFGGGMGPPTGVGGGEPPPSEDAHPPASKRFVFSLPEVVITKEDLDVETTNAECAICLNEQKLGQSAARMPCGHIFCGECLRRWLAKSNNCPVCRYEVETDFPEYEERRLKNMKGRKMRFRHRELEAKSVGELRALLRSLHLSSEGCIEKSDMVSRLENSGKIELMKTCVAQQIYTLHELMAMDIPNLKRLITGLGVRANPSIKDRFDLIRCLANSGRAIVSTEGASEEELAELSRQMSTTVHAQPSVDEEVPPKLQRTVAAGRNHVAYPSTLSRAQLEAMRVGQLKDLLFARKISPDGLLEKKDLIDKLIEYQTDNL